MFPVLLQLRAMSKRKRETIEFINGSLSCGSHQPVFADCSLQCSPQCSKRVTGLYTSIRKVCEARGAYTCKHCAQTPAGKKQKADAVSGMDVDEFVLGQLSDMSNKMVRAACSSGVSKKCTKYYTAQYWTIRRNCNENAGQYVCHPCAMRLKKAGHRNPAAIYDLDENLFRDMDNEFKPYFLGWIAGDGNFQKKGGIKIDLNKKDRHILEDLRDGICPGMPISRTTEDMVRLHISSVKMNADGRRWLGLSHFTEDGSWKKSHCVQFPHALPTEEAKWHFLRGYFEADGCVLVTKKHGAPRTEITSMSLGMLESIRSFVGLPSTLSGPHLRWAGVASLHFLSRLYAGANYKLKRKYNKFVEIQSWRPRVIQPHVRELAAQLDTLPVYHSELDGDVLS